MKAILLALCAGILLFGAITLELRCVRTPRRALMLVATYLIGLVFLAVIHFVTPDDLGFLPSHIIANNQVVDLFFCLYLFSSGFFGGLLQLYNLADRGFSLRILIDILESSAGYTAAVTAARGYAAGRGLRWMYEKRIDGMKASRLITTANNRMQLTRRGLRAARIFMILGTIYGLGWPREPHP